MTKRETKDCPFCGNDIVECLGSTGESGNVAYHVECCNCLCRTPYFSHPQLAVESWNARCPDPDDIDYKDS